MKLWAMTLGAWLILHGLSQLVSFSFSYDDELSGLLALLAGIFLLIRK